MNTVKEILAAIVKDIIDFLPIILMLAGLYGLLIESARLILLAILVAIITKD